MTSSLPQYLRRAIMLLAGAAALPSVAQTPLKSLNYLYTISGSKVIGGIHNKEPLREPAAYTEQLHFVTGKYAGLWGGDFLFQSYADRWQMIYETEKQWQKGAFVTLTWHGCNPALNVSPCQWEGGVVSKMSDADWTALVTDGTPLNLRWKAWLDDLVPYFQYLKDRGVEVAFRPLHETNQGVFWWGGRPGPEGSRKLYQLTHDYLQKTKNLSNIIWVWNIQDFPSLPDDVNAYNPGSDYFDVASLDFYNGDGLTTAKYNALLGVAAGKPIAIGEIGRLPTAAQLAAQPKWSYFMGWSELVFQQNTSAQLQALYSAGNVLTLGQMPGWGLASPTAGNLAYHKAVVASSTEGDLVAANVVDGDRTTRWASNYADPQDITVDLGGEHRLNRVNLVWETALGKEYEVQTSLDNVSWTTLKRVTGNATQHNDHTGLNATARYVRIHGTARGTAYGYSLREVEVYGDVVTATAATQRNAGLQVYPNPAANRLTVALGTEWPRGSKLVVLNSVGQSVGAPQIVQGATQVLSTAELRPGLYLLRVQHQGAVSTIPFVKQ